MATPVYGDLTVHLGTSLQTQTDLPERGFEEWSLHTTYKIKTHAKCGSKGKFQLFIWKTFLKARSLVYLWIHILNYFQLLEQKQYRSLCSGLRLSLITLKLGTCPFPYQEEGRTKRLSLQAACYLDVKSVVLILSCVLASPGEL